MARMATDFAYAVLRRMGLRDEAERSLRQLDDLDDFYDPFAAIGLQRYAAQPRHLARHSVMDMIVMYMGYCCPAPGTSANRGQMASQLV